MRMVKWAWDICPCYLWPEAVLFQQKIRRMQASNCMVRTEKTIKNSWGKWLLPLPATVEVLLLRVAAACFLFCWNMSRRGRTLPREMTMVRYEGKPHPSGSSFTMTGSSTLCTLINGIKKIGLSVPRIFIFILNGMSAYILLTQMPLTPIQAATPKNTTNKYTMGSISKIERNFQLLCATTATEEPLCYKKKWLGWRPVCSHVWIALLFRVG